MRLFSYKVEEHLTDSAYSKLKFVFPGTTIPSAKENRTHAAFLSAFQVQRYDCCINSCCCFVGPNQDIIQCPFCNEPRFNASGHTRKRYTYIPLIARLVGMYRNKECALQLRYRDNYQPDPDGTMKDVMDGTHYKNLRKKNVVVDGDVRNHKFFSDWHDVALGLSTDGFAPFRRRKQTCWPIITTVYNFPPELRCLRGIIMPLGVIPGPRKPKDFDSYLWPLVDELMRLAVGVPAFDASTSSAFTLRAYLLYIFGDIPAVSMVMHMKGHNGYRPCRLCNITGLGIPGSRVHTLYVPHHRKNHPDVQSDPTAVQMYDTSALPLRTHAEILQQAESIQFAPTTTISNNLATKYGIKGKSILFSLSSLSFPESFPYDFMHMVYENVLPNLISFWTGSYKDLDHGGHDYVLDKKVWERVGSATAAAGSSIPSAFGQRPPDPEGNRMACTAESWSFWMQYLAPALLENKFVRSKYFSHFLHLVKLVKICTQFEITRDEQGAVREGFQAWVRDYEK
jgi:Transposase family tnp2